MDEWGWEHLQPWLNLRLKFPVGALFCVTSLWPGVTARS
jgi:hypothetical protein